MKYYYNGQLMRTSKNHVYTHAVVIENESGVHCYGCHKDRKGCEAEINSAISRCNRGITNAQAAIKALNAGKAGYYYNEGRHSWWSRFSDMDGATVERFEDQIKRNNDYIEGIRRTWKIVELEAR